MSHRTVPLPRDIAGLTRLVLAQEAENERLKAQLATLKRLIFGSRSETLASIDPDQGRLALGDLVEGGTPPDAAVDRMAEVGGQDTRRVDGRKTADRNIGALPAHLPRCEQVIEPEATACPCCGGSLHRIGETWSEALDVVPAIVRVTKTIRPKYACRACECRRPRRPA